jgi:type III pantothenate kinase
MILACDIGNTNIAVGLFKGRSLVLKSCLPTQKSTHFKSFLRNSFGTKSILPGKIGAAVICSVVPGVNRSIKKAIKAIAAIPIYVLGENLEVPIKNLYAYPRQVGQDRLACAYAAQKLYGAPVITVDLGTAITLDVVSEKREYLGGIILPGLNLSLSALHRQTALLPQTGLRRPKALIGRDTADSMLSGATFGFGAMIDGLIEKLKERLKEPAKVIAVGGDCLFIKPYCRQVDYFEEDLILRGMVELASPINKKDI